MRELISTRGLDGRAARNIVRRGLRNILCILTVSDDEIGIDRNKVRTLVAPISSGSNDSGLSPFSRGSATAVVWSCLHPRFLLCVPFAVLSMFQIGSACDLLQKFLYNDRYTNMNMSGFRLLRWRRLRILTRGLETLPCVSSILYLHET